MKSCTSRMCSLLCINFTLIKGKNKREIDRIYSHTTWAKEQYWDMQIKKKKTYQMKKMDKNYEQAFHSKVTYITGKPGKRSSTSLVIINTN